jgi:hypothetical protein
MIDGGSYTGSASPSGTFDQGGNVWEWNESFVINTHGLRGGDFSGSSNFLAASFRSEIYALSEENGVGFRVVNLPEPGTTAGLVAGVLLLGLLERRRSRIFAARRSGISP